MQGHASADLAMLADDGLGDGDARARGGGRGGAGEPAADPSGTPYADADSVCLACLNVSCACGLNRRVGGRFGYAQAGGSGNASAPSMQGVGVGVPAAVRRRAAVRGKADDGAARSAAPYAHGRAAPDERWTTGAVLAVAVSAALFGTLVAVAVIVFYFLPRLETQAQPLSSAGRGALRTDVDAGGW